MPARRRDPISVPRTFHSPSLSGHHVRHDYGIDESISRAGYFSNAVLEDTEAAAARSRGKDYDLLRNTHSAIIDTEMHASPRAAVASMRARASSVPPKVQGRPARLQHQLNNRPKVVGSPQLAPTIICVSTPPVAPNPVRTPSSPVVQSEVPWRLRAGSVPRSIRAGSVPPRPMSYHGDFYELDSEPSFGTESLRAHRPPVVLRSRVGSVPPPVPRSVRAGSLPPPRLAQSSNVRLIRAGSVQPLRRQSYHPGDRQCVGTEGLRAHRPPAVSRLSRAESLGRLNRNPYEFELDDVYGGERRAKKAVPRGTPAKKNPIRRASHRAASEPPAFIPPSQNYPRIPDVQPKAVRHLYARRGQGPRQIDRPQSSIFYDPGQSSGLYATRQPLPKPSERKPIRTVDGFTKPKNVMSWEYRVESRLSPDDLLYTPSSFGRMRDQVRGAQEKIDRHRQLLDRYLDSDTKPASSYSSSNSVNSPKSSVKIPDYYYAGGDPNNAPMSDLRRRLRRTLAKTKSH